MCYQYNKNTKSNKNWRVFIMESASGSITINKATKKDIKDIAELI